MTEENLPRVLCVDDDSNLLEGLERTLAFQFDVTLANGPGPALELLRRDRDFAVVMSDMRMPEMDGATFLAHVKREVPSAVRLLLTGDADVRSAADAINKGEIFRFLTKPCAAPLLIRTIDDAVAQHRLITAEKVLLEQTLHGSVKALVDVLALASPQAFGRAVQVKRRVMAMLDHLEVKDRWAIEVAALLSQVPCVTLPPDTVGRYLSGAALNRAEQKMVDDLPRVAETFFGNIPRLERVLEVLRHQATPFRGEGEPTGKDIPLGGRILHVVLQFETLKSRGLRHGAALERLEVDREAYDPELVALFRTVVGSEDSEAPVRKVALRDLRVGMTFAEDVKTRENVLVVPSGHEVTAPLLRRLSNFASGAGLREPLVVTMPAESGPVRR